MPHDDGCPEHGGWTRRSLLVAGALGSGALLLPRWMPRAVAGGPPGGRDVLVYLFLRGGLDGLSFLSPWADGDYFAARPTIAVPPPGAAGGSLDLDGFFGLLPAAAPLLPAYAAGRLAFVHAVGVGDLTPSHFEAFKKVEFGLPGYLVQGDSSGWLARHLQLVAPVAEGPLRAAVLRETLPLTLRGAPRTLPVGAPADFGFAGDPASASLRKAALHAMYGGQPAPLGPAAIDTLGTIELFAGIDFDAPPEHGAEYPDTDLGRGLSACAALIRAQAPVEVLMIDVDGYDHHSAQAPLDGKLAILADDLARSIAAFDRDLGPLLDGVTLMAHSEFGRRIAENGSAGTDHGFAGVLLALSGHVAGARVHGLWPGCGPTTQFDGNLAPTTDLRTVMAELLVKRLGAQAADVPAIFPGHLGDFPGLFLD